MEFLNLTPFAAQAYGGFDTQDREYYVIALRVGYRLQTDLRSPGLFDAIVLDDDPVPLVMADDWYGEDNSSSVRAESDLAPYKPRCDVVVLGQAYAPRGAATSHWDTRLRLGYAGAPAMPLRPPEPRPLNPLMPVDVELTRKWEHDVAAFEVECAKRASQIAWREIVLDKTLRVHGPRHFQHRVGHWSAGVAEPASRVALRWEHTYGGTSSVTDDEGRILINEPCYANPLGCGWIEQGWFDALAKAGRRAPDLLPAPQIEYPNAGQRAPDIVAQPHGVETAVQMAELAAKLRHRPAGYGWVGRAWAPRLARAGTYDTQWLDTRWPYLPKDLDFRYWNGAPDDQQIAFPEPGFAIELTHLADPARVGADVLTVRLPAHRAFLRVLLGELGLPIPMQIDTVVIDADAFRVDLVWRAAVLRSMDPEAIEARFETDPSATLIKHPAEGMPA